MEYRPFGRTGISISILGFGCGNVGGVLVRGTPEEQHSAVACALEGGINYFDTAASYGKGLSETNLGRVLADLGASPYVGTKLRIERDELVDVSAVIRHKLEEGLHRLGRARVDVCTLHNRVGPGPTMLSASEIAGPVADAMENLVADGLAAAIGFTGLGETKEIHAVAASGRFDVVQCYYNVLNQSAVNPGSPDGIAQDFDGLVDVAMDRAMAIVGIRALAGGALGGTGSRHRLAGDVGNPMAEGEEYGEDVRRAMRYEDDLALFGVSSLAELAVRFALSNEKFSTVLAGFSDKDQVEQLLSFAALGPLRTTVIEELESLA